MIVIRRNIVARIIVRDERMNSMLRTRVKWHGSRSGSGRWRSGSGRNGSRRNGSGRADSIGFKNNSLLVPPFIKYNIIRLNKFVC